MEDGMETVDLAIKNKTERQKFIIKLREKEAECTRTHKPLNYKAAKYLFELQQDQVFRQKGFRAGNCVENVKVTIDIDEFAEPSRFVLDSKKPCVEKRWVDGSQMEVTEADYLVFKDKEYGNLMRVKVPREKKK